MSEIDLSIGKKITFSSTEDTSFLTPRTMKWLIGKEIKLETVLKTALTGIVYVIDPAFKTVVMCKPQLSAHNKPEVTLVPYHALQSIEILSDTEHPFMKTLENCLSANKNVDSQQVEGKKKKLLKWLQSNQIEAKLNGNSIEIGEGLQIQPPYDAENCICSNQVVLERIQGLLKSMSQDSTT